MAVITPEGIVGKIYRVYPTSSLVLTINDPSSGAGVILEKSRLQGIVRGTPNGGTVVQNIMSDEKLEIGEPVLTSGGDRVFPKGLPVGVVSSVGSGSDLFLNVRLKPAAPLNRLEEVLVITKIVEKTPDANEPVIRQRAADILAERLPTVPPKPPETPATAGAKPPAGTQPKAAIPAGTSTAKPDTAKPAQPKPVQPAAETPNPGGPVARPPAAGVAGNPAITKPPVGTAKPSANGAANPAFPSPKKAAPPTDGSGMQPKPPTTTGSGLPPTGAGTAVQTKPATPASGLQTKPPAPAINKKPSDTAKPAANTPANLPPKDTPR